MEPWNFTIDCMLAKIKEIWKSKVLLDGESTSIFNTTTLLQTAIIAGLDYCNSSILSPPVNYPHSCWIDFLKLRFSWYLPISTTLLHPSPLATTNLHHELSFLGSLGSTYKSDHIVFVFLHQSYITYHNTLKVHPCYCK